MTSNSGAAAELPRPRPGDPPMPVVPRPSRQTLSNGLRVLTVERHHLPQVAIRLVLPAGSAADPADAFGTAALVSSLLTEGSELLPALQLNERLDAIGASVSARVGHDFAEIDLVLLSETLAEGLALFGEIVARPSFPEREVERNRAETLDALEARLDEPANVADDALSDALFGAGHPYGRLPMGSPEGVARVAREALQEFHRLHYRPAGGVLVAAGDFRATEFLSLLEKALAGWSGEVGIVPYDPAVPARPADTAIGIEWKDAAQGEIRLGSGGLERRSPDWIPAAVANYILGGSTITGRLGANLREDKGWTYGVRSGFAAGIGAAGWAIETSVEAEATEAALTEIDRELHRMLSEPVEGEELDRAREAMILSLPRAFETPARIVARLATVEAFGLEPDYWERFGERVKQVTRDDVLRIASEHFAPQRLIRVTVGPRIGSSP